MKYTKSFIKQKLGQMKIIVDENLDALKQEIKQSDPMEGFKVPLFDNVVDRLREIDDNIVEFCADRDGTSTLIFDILADDGYFGFDMLTCDVAIKELNRLNQNAIRNN